MTLSEDLLYFQISGVKATANLFEECNSIHSTLPAFLFLFFSIFFVCVHLFSPPTKWLFGVRIFSEYYMWIIKYKFVGTKLPPP